MNKREKLASVILVVTLALGTAVDILGKRDGRAGLEGRDGFCAGAADSCGRASAACAAGGVEQATAAADGAADGGAGVEPEAGGGSYRKIDLNAACLEELELLPGIGPKKAQALLEWRTRNRRFKRLEDVLEVKGIGPGTLERLRPYATVGD